MILSDRELQFALDRGQFGVTPRPKPSAFASTAFDLCLDGKLSIWDEAKLKADPGMGVAELCFCPTAAGFNVRKVIRERTRIHDLQVDGTYRMPPRGGAGARLPPGVDPRKAPHPALVAALCQGRREE